MKLISKINFKNFTIIVTIITICLIICSSSTLAKYSKELTTSLSVQINGDYQVTESNNTVTITKYVGLGGNITIPDSLNNKPVATIGANAFSNNSTITNVSFPSTITSIDTNAFYNCKNMVGELKLPQKLKTIGNSAFFNCTGLSGYLNLPNSVTTILESAFLGCSNLNGIILSNSLTNIGNSAFNSCTNLTGNLVIPNSVTSIGISAFYGCSGLTGILTIPSSITTISAQSFMGCIGLIGLNFPSNLSSIENNAFSSCTSLTRKFKYTKYRYKYWI